VPIPPRAGDPWGAESYTDADGGAIDRGDYGLEALEDPWAYHTAIVTCQAVVELDTAAAFGKRLSSSGPVRTSARRATSAGDDHDALVMVRIDLIERLDQYVHHPVRERIELVGRCNVIVATLSATS
jgi:hypothetical protein